MNKVVLVVIDGLGYETAVNHCGYLEGLVRRGEAARWRMAAALPSMSRPLYETIHTGLEPHDHGITSNDVVRRSESPSIFGIVKQNGGRTGAAAFSWFSELYNSAPYNPLVDCEIDDPDKDIQHGRFYCAEQYPDADLLARASSVMHRYAPDYMLVHPMSCDHTGHTHGGASPEYRTQATRIDALLARFLPAWRDIGYQVAVTADHGMNADGYHGGTLDDVLDVAFYIAQPGRASPAPDQKVSQLSVAPTILSMLGLKPPSTMTSEALI